MITALDWANPRISYKPLSNCWEGSPYIIDKLLKTQGDWVSIENIGTIIANQ